MNKYLIKLLDRNKNKKVDWYEILFPTPDINKNKQVDWWEALIGIIFFIGFFYLSLLIKYKIKNFQKKYPRYIAG